MVLIRFAWLILAFWVSGAGSLAAQAGQATARRIADVASIALDEYALGVVDGKVINPAELEEAQLFLAEARRVAGELPPALAQSVAARLDSLRAGVGARRPVAELRTLLARVREELARGVGVSLDPLPRVAPSLVAAAAAYDRLCSGCHGVRGRGDGPLAAGLLPPPADLTDPALSATSPLDFFRKINVGVAGTAMPGFSEQLTEEERWALALYTSGLRSSEPQRVVGEAVLRDRCPDCLPLISGFSETAALSDDSLAGILAARLGAAPDDSTVQAAIAFARTGGAVEELGADPRLTARRVVDGTRAAVAAVVEAARGEDRRAAAQQALDAYLVFERIESLVRARDAGAAAAVERAFAELRAAATAGSVNQVQRAAERVHRALDGAVDVLNAGSSAALLFGQSLLIMLREGFEAILIIGALVAFLVRAGAAERKREIGWGVLAALVASLLTAAAYGTLFRHATASREALEGVTMLVAAVVLFWVSYWLVSKIELRKWQAFVAARMTQALSSRRALALAAVAFLAVYREGFETVLFYAALLASAGRVPGAGAAVSGGILAGLSALGVVYFLMQRYGSRIPLKSFFAVTSALLYLMAFSFVGQGIAELQEAGYILTTPLPGLPMFPALGIFPTIQTTLLQGVLVVALLGALLWVFWLAPRYRAVAGGPS